jgi:hypothetical protein
MSDVPRLLCPQCGGDLRGTSGNACPQCGFYIGSARVQHRGALHYWRFLRARRWIEVVSVLAWLAGIALSLWIISFNPGWGMIVLAAVAGLGATVLNRYLTLRKRTRK